MKRITNITIVLTILLSLVSVSLAFAGSELIWQIGDFDNSRADLKGSGLTGIHEFDFYVGTHTASDFPGTLYYSIPSPYDYRGVHKVNIHFTLVKPYMDVDFIYGRGGDETDEITLDLDGTPLATIAGIENSWEGSPYTIPIGELAQGDHFISIEVTDGGILDDAHVVDALRLTGIPVSSYNLIAGQHDDVGDVLVWDDDTSLFVKYVTDDACLNEVHLEAASDLDGIPQTKKGNPIPGQFSEFGDYSSSSCVTESDTFVLPLNACNYIAAHAEVFVFGGSNSTNIVYELINPGAETGDMTGWDFSGPVRAIDVRPESCGDVYPRSGEYFFDMTEYPASDGSMWQEVDVASYAGALYKAGGWVQTELYPDVTKTGITENDYGELIVTFKDIDGFELSSVSSGPIGNPVCGDPNGDLYASFQIEGYIPDGAVSAVYQLKGYLVGGSYVNVFYDDLFFDIALDETAWGEGTEFDGKNWAMYFTYGTCPP